MTWSNSPKNKLTLFVAIREIIFQENINKNDNQTSLPSVSGGQKK